MCDINRWAACMPRMFTPAGEEFGEEERVKHEEKEKKTSMPELIPLKKI